MEEHQSSFQLRAHGKKYPDGSLSLFHVLIVACCLVPGLSFYLFIYLFMHDNDKMAEGNLLMTTLLNFATQNNLMFLPGQALMDRWAVEQSWLKSNDVNDGKP